MSTRPDEGLMIVKVVNSLYTLSVKIEEGLKTLGRCLEGPQKPWSRHMNHPMSGHQPRAGHF